MSMIVDVTVKGNFEATLAGATDTTLATPGLGRVMRLRGVTAINPAAATGIILLLKDGIGGPTRWPATLQQTQLGNIPSLLAGPAAMPDGIDFFTGLVANSSVTGVLIQVSVKEY